MPPVNAVQPAWLVLEDGSVFEGRAMGETGRTMGELVFNTAATGYQEVLTDPSYRGQIVMMTYPEIGNYGVNVDDFESEKIHVAGFVVKRLSPVTSSWRATLTLQDFLYRNGIVGIEGVDTRALTRKIRDKGALKAGITTHKDEALAFLEKVKAQPSLDQQDLVGQVTTPTPYKRVGHAVAENTPTLDRLVVVDFGIKKSILSYLEVLVKEIIVVPAWTTFEEIMAYGPQGVLLSNGPGDPAILHGPIAMAQKLIAAKIPTFGICLGHQILALASGAQVSKMPFGHHGGNHPVKDLETNKITITSQNHGYAVNPNAVPEGVMAVTHLNLNDGSIEGFRHKTSPVCSVQFHPEASPGPHDTQYLFGRFVSEVLAWVPA